VISSNKKKYIYVAGHGGMVGSSICNELNAIKDINLITRKSSELDLTNQLEVENFFKTQSISEVYLAAAKVGGIHANNEYPAEFIYRNLQIQSNVIHSSYIAGIKKLVFLGSSCIYPKFAEQPMNEASLLSGKLEPTNEPYAIAKIAGIKLCESYNRQYNVDYRSVMPTNLYGPGDNYHPENSHVIPALIRKFYEAKINQNDVTIWGSGSQRREFLFVSDMAKAAVHVMNADKEIYDSLTSPMESHINIGTNEDISIKELSNLIAKKIGFNGNISYDLSKPDGPPKKLMNSKKAFELGWQPKISIDEGIQLAYEDFIKNYKQLRSS
jgi:GDP-L-fucose synthase